MPKTQVSFSLSQAPKMNSNKNIFFQRFQKIEKAQKHTYSEKETL